MEPSYFGALIHSSYLPNLCAVLRPAPLALYYFPFLSFPLLSHCIGLSLGSKPGGIYVFLVIVFVYSFLVIQVNWLITDVFYPDFRIYPYRVQKPGTSQYIYMQIPLLITDNLIRTSPKPDNFRSTLFTI